MGTQAVIQDSFQNSVLMSVKFRRRHNKLPAKFGSKKKKSFLKNVYSTILKAKMHFFLKDPPFKLLLLNLSKKISRNVGLFCIITQLVCRRAILFACAILCAPTVVISKEGLGKMVQSLVLAQRQNSHGVILRWNSWTAIKQKTRVFCSMLFTVPSTGGF